MKKIDIAKMLKDNELDYIDRRELLGMEFIRLVDGNYLVKNSNGRIVSEKEKLQLENDELVLEDIKKDCAKEITKKISKNKKRIKEIEEDALLKETDTTME